jgi:EAL domain-containing protein (putative c-di-GMP-specific phosphodiesterase class I)
VQFNLSQRFDMLVLETLFSMLHKHPGQRFSVNLLPATLMQKNSAGRLSRCFNAIASRQNLSLLR